MARMLYGYAEHDRGQRWVLAVVQTVLPPRRAVGNELCRITRSQFNLTLCYFENWQSTVDTSNFT